MVMDDENKPLNGGEVTICSGCQQRERKRAGRKKVKKPEEEEAWLKDEAKRVVVFNTNEIKEWLQPSKEPAADTISERPAPEVPEGAMQVDAPMRIACYCRHQSEKIGFQVIFTVKDWEDKLVAQAITSSIMITDDHKTTTGPQGTHSQHSSMNEGFGMPHPQLNAGGPSYGMQPQQQQQQQQQQQPSNGFRASYSHSDLQSLQRNNFVPQFAQAPAGNFPPSFPSQNTSASQTPRNLSRQASPSGPTGPSHKKRKSSGPTKVPSGLAMTRLETGDAQGGVGFGPNGSTSANASAAPSPYTTRFGPLIPPGDNSYVNSTSTPSHIATGPSTPSGTEYGFLGHAHRSHSMENLVMGPMFSAPASAHPSRPPSPTGGHRSANTYQQAQVAQAVVNGLYGMPLNLNPHRPPTIHRIIPAEGPKAGGIEVTCLGSGFCQGLEVMFGDSLATTTTFWGERSLVCLLPPAAQAGTVSVTFKHQHQQHMQQYQPAPPSLSNVMFKYVDDDEMQLLRLALSVLGHKMTGRLDDVSDIARNIVGSAGNNIFGNSTGNSPSGSAQHGPNNQHQTLDLETTLLKCLDLIDLDDSSHQARWSLRRPSGQTMLHLACSLGMQRFVAALLARGANPDPRDRGGFSPMHFAALQNQSRIVQKLIMNGADPTMRSLLGFTPADLATSKEVLAATRSLQHHPRSRSGVSSHLRDRTTSATSLKATWERPRASRQVSKTGDDALVYDDSSASESYLEDADEVSERPSDHGFWIKSRRNSTSEQQEIISQLPVPSTPGVAVGASAAMTAWRAQLTTQLQNIQQTVHWNLPTLPQMPALPPMPNLPDYQTYLPHPVRRISSLVPNRGNSRPTSSAITSSKDADYKWWELFSSSAPPPAYDEIYPANDTPVMDEKKTAAVQMVADTLADQKCSTMFDVDTAESSTAGLMPEMIDLRQGRQGSLTKEQADQLRVAHARKIKRIKSDRNLFFIWVSLLWCSKNQVLSLLFF